MTKTIDELKREVVEYLIPPHRLPDGGYVIEKAIDYLHSQGHLRTGPDIGEMLERIKSEGWFIQIRYPWGDGAQAEIFKSPSVDGYEYGYKRTEVLLEYGENPASAIANALKAIGGEK